MELQELLSFNYTSHALYDRPDLYDLDYQGYVAEAAFYYQLINRGLTPEQVYVELGAGSGRLLETPLNQGVKCHAVEPNIKMLQALKDKMRPLEQKIDLSCEQASAHDFVGPPDSEIGLVSFPFNGLLHLFTSEELISSFLHIHRQLAPQGRLALDIMAPAWEVMGVQELDWGRLDERRTADEGVLVYTYDRCSFEEKNHLIHSKLRFIKAKATQGVELHYVQRMWTFQEVISALIRTGFYIEEIYGDVDFSSFDEDSPRLLVVAAK
jgi:hypothetical protein